MGNFTLNYPPRSNSGGGGGSPAGPNLSVQYNSDGSFGGNSGFTYNTITATLTLINSSNAGEFDFGSAGSLRYDGFGNLTLTQTSSGQQLAFVSGGAVSLQDSTGSTGGLGISSGNVFIRLDLQIFGNSIQFTNPGAVSLTDNSGNGYNLDGSGNATIDGTLTVSGGTAIIGTNISLVDDGADNVYLKNITTSAMLSLTSDGHASLVDTSGSGLRIVTGDVDTDYNLTVGKNLTITDFIYSTRNFVLMDTNIGIIYTPTKVISIDTQNRYLSADGITKTVDYANDQLSNLSGLVLDWSVGLNAKKSLTFGNAASGLIYTTGSNGRTGQATLGIGGIVTVSNNSVTAKSLVLASTVVPGGTQGALYVGVINPGVNFVVHSTNIGDTSTFRYMIIETT